jgi:hypothetical protein
MPTYPVSCHRRGCGHPALFKIAARWSDGITEELKTYALSCDQCLPTWYRQSCAKQTACRRAPGEILESPGIYRLARGRRDAQLERLVNLELQLGGASSAT